jgi:hypothetical protein
VQLPQPLDDNQAQPEEERELGFAQIILQTFHPIDVGVLDHVRGVEASLQARVESHLHHASQALAVLGDEGAGPTGSQPGHARSSPR